MEKKLHQTAQCCVGLTRSALCSWNTAGGTKEHLLKLEKKSRGVYRCSGGLTGITSGRHSQWWPSLPQKSLCSSSCLPPPALPRCSGADSPVGGAASSLGCGGGATGSQLAVHPGVWKTKRNNESDQVRFWVTTVSSPDRRETTMEVDGWHSVTLLHSKHTTSKHTTSKHTTSKHTCSLYRVIMNRGKNNNTKHRATHTHTNTQRAQPDTLTSGVRV